jgi:tetratricopeptide (TPR) repeat protein
MADHYTYLPLTGIFIILAWVTPDLIKSGRIRKYILLPAAILSIFISAFLSWQQCGYWKNSKELYRHAINVESDNYRANYGFGLALLKEGNSEEAIYYFNKSISKSPNFAYAYNSRGNAYIRLGLHQRALDDFNKAIHLKPDLEIAYNNKSNVYYELGRYQQAIENYSKAIQFKPDYVEAYLNRARAYYKLGNYELAVEDYNEAMRLNNNYMPAE